VRTLRVLSFGVMATLLAGGGNALACRGLQWERTIFFDEVSANIDVPAIVQVTITEMVTTERYDQVGVARVHRVIKGPIDGQTLKIVAMPTSCGGGIAPGASGIVMGTLRRDAQGELELVAISETVGERLQRKNSAGGPRP
jgi:hypothetical protein